jgi:hypothetical protein
MVPEPPQHQVSIGRMKENTGKQKSGNGQDGTHAPQDLSTSLQQYQSIFIGWAAIFVYWGQKTPEWWICLTSPTVSTQEQTQIISVTVIYQNWSPWWHCRRTKYLMKNGKDIPNHLARLFITSIKHGLDWMMDQITPSNLEATNLKEVAGGGKSLSSSLGPVKFLLTFSISGYIPTDTYTYDCLLTYWVPYYDLIFLNVGTTHDWDSGRWRLLPARIVRYGCAW